MRLLELDISGYRSIRGLSLRLEQVNVLVGSNGCGKTNLYRSLFLLSAAARGELARALAEEGGMPSVLWAGKRTKGPVQVRLGVTLENLAYELACGLPIPSAGPTYFSLDPLVKEETVRLIDGRKRIAFLERAARSVWARDMEGRRAAYPLALDDAESVLSQIAEPHRYPELSVLRQEMLGWRFYHHFDASSSSALRQPQVGFRSPVLDHDGRNLAAALRTIVEIGDGEGLAEAIELAFRGSSLRIELSERGSLFSVAMRIPGIQRALDARELSDGTLRYLCLVAALMSPRPPALLVLNEPETSIHPDLIAPLARLITRASRCSQLLVTTHSEALAKLIAEESGSEPIQLEKVEGETRVER